MDKEMYLATRQAEDRLWWYHGMRRISERLLREYVGRRGLNILDAGCGTGGAMTWLSDWGRVSGIDLSDVALEFCRRRALPRLACASVTELPFRDRSFDLVTSFDVIYHLWVDDRAAMREFARVLRPGGHALVRVAANDWLRGEHDRAGHTRQRYDLAELRGRLEGAGLEVVAASYANAFLFPVAVAKRWLDRAEKGNDFWLPPAPLNALLGGLLGLEAGLVARSALPIGLSAVALARKPGSRSP